ncbi:MAG: alkaline shock response membrane anchor protein AmaP [Candidatus Omnitrophica bacterium]|nr:alkaline shock response membrane anchor protein AmaP [Candidatus Omnitrophota bacterium]
MGFLAILVYIFISFFLGFVLIGSAANFLDLSNIVFFVERELFSNIFFRFAFGLSGLLIILFCVRYIQHIIYRRERSIVSESEYGKVSITLFAIEDMLKNMLETEKGFSHTRPRVCAGKRGVTVVIRGNVNSEVNFLSFTKEVQERVREKLLNLLGEGKDIKVKIEIKKMLFKGGKKIVEVEEPEIPYRYY